MGYRQYYISIILIVIYGLISCVYAFDSDDGYTIGNIKPIIEDVSIMGKPEIIIKETEEDMVLVSVDCVNIRDHFKARATIHNRTAEYYLSNVYNKKIFIDGKLTNNSSAIINRNKHDVYVKVIMRYKTSNLNIKKGWPEYYYLSLSNSIEYDGGDENEPISVAYIKGQVLHATEWDRKRDIYNEEMGYGKINNSIIYENYKSLKMGRYNNVFWPGEMFVLKCGTRGVSKEKVKVKIKNTDYQKYIYHKGDGLYEGYIFEGSMFKKWYSTDAIRLEFIFEVGKLKDEVYVIVDGADNYYKLHRID